MAWIWWGWGITLYTLLKKGLWQWRWGPRKERRSTFVCSQGQETDLAEPKVSSDNPKSSRGKTRKRKSGVTSSKSVKTPRKGRSTKTESKINDGKKQKTALPSPRPSRPRRPLDLTRRRTNLLTILVQLIPARRIRNQVHRQVLPPRTSFHKCRFQALCLGPPSATFLQLKDLRWDSHAQMTAARFLLHHRCSLRLHNLRQPVIRHKVHSTKT